MPVTKTNDRTLDFNGRQVEFEKRIQETLISPTKLIILFRVNDYELGDEMVGQNIVAYDEAGNFLWRVEATGLRRPNEDDEIDEFGPDARETYFDILINEKGELWGGTPSVEVLIDMKTGEVLDAEQAW